MSNDPKNKPLDPAPTETPDILQRDLNLDRRTRPAPSFDQLKTNVVPPGRTDVATTQPGIPGPFAKPPAAPPAPARPPLGNMSPGQPARQPTHFELAATAQTPRQAMAQARPQVTAQPATTVPAPQVTRAPVNAAPPGLAPRAPLAAPTQPPPQRAAPPPPQRAPVAPPQAQRPPAPPPPRTAGPVTIPEGPPVAPPRAAVPAAPPRAAPPPDATRPGIAPRQAPPSPTDWAARTAVPNGTGQDAPTAAMQAIGPKLTVANAMQGATIPSGPQRPVSYAPAHQPIARAPEPEHIEHPTTPNRPVVARPAPVQPAFQELPHAMPSHLVVTQPGFPNPYPAQRAQPVAATKSSLETPPPAGPTRVIEGHTPAQPSAMPIFTPPDFGEVPAFESAAPPSEPVESLDEAVEGDVLAAPASLWRRTFAWLFDLSVIAVVVSAFFGAALAVIGRPSPSLLLSVAVPALGVVGFVAFVYTTLFAFLWHGRTPGRRILGIHLVDASGHAPRAGRALVRAALSLASFALFLSGFWLALFDRRGQTLHDKLTSTFVVRLKPAV